MCRKIKGRFIAAQRFQNINFSMTTWVLPTSQNAGHRPHSPAGNWARVSKIAYLREARRSLQHAGDVGCAYFVRQACRCGNGADGKKTIGNAEGIVGRRTKKWINIGFQFAVAA